MYERFYGLQERPFDLTPNPRFLLMTPRHQEALSTLEYGISSRKGVALVVGAAGTGKTTLVRAALDSQRGQASLGICLSNPVLTRAEFFEFLADGFGLGRKAAHSKTRLLIELRALLESRHQSGAATALIVDEAQSLPDELLEELRLLANIETSTAKLLAVILVGQPDLAQRLNRPQLQQLKQRVALRSVLTPLDGSETNAYIRTRIGIAGGDAAHVFTPDVVAEIHKRSGGIPRTVNVICDNALVAGFALDQRPVSRKTVIDVCRDLDFPVVVSALVSAVAPPPSPTIVPAPQRTVAPAAAAAMPAPIVRASTPPLRGTVPSQMPAAGFGPAVQAPVRADRTAAKGPTTPQTQEPPGQFVAARATAPAPTRPIAPRVTLPAATEPVVAAATAPKGARKDDAAVRPHATAPTQSQWRFLDRFRWPRRSRPISVFETHS